MPSDRAGRYLLLPDAVGLALRAVGHKARTPHRRLSTMIVTESANSSTGNPSSYPGSLMYSPTNRAGAAVVLGAHDQPSVPTDWVRCESS